MPRVIRDHGNEKKGRRIRKLSLVMKGGTVYYPAELYEAMGVRRFEDSLKVTAAN